MVRETVLIAGATEWVGYRRWPDELFGVPFVSRGPTDAARRTEAAHAFSAVIRLAYEASNGGQRLPKKSSVAECAKPIVGNGLSLSQERRKLARV
jgi:hypothetical protein